METGNNRIANHCLEATPEGAHQAHVGSMKEDGFEIRPYSVFIVLEKVQNMTIAEKIVSHIHKMPEPEQVEVLDFIEYLETKARQRRARDEEESWSVLSLASAMRGMEEEPSEYDTNDLKEKF